MVTGSRIEEPARESLVSTDVIRREEIEQSGARNAADLLEERDGVTIQRSFAGSALLLRGLDPEYTLILVDGDRVPGQTNGAIDLNRFGVENIERIEVVRGPGSALYGSDAIGGVVNIITRKPQKDFEADGSFSYGERTMLDATGRVGAALAETLHAQVTGGYHHGDSFQSSADTGGSGFSQGDAGFKLWFEPDSKNRIIAAANYLNQTLQGIDMGAGGAVLDRTQQQEQFSSSIEYRLRASNSVELVQRASYSQFRDQYLSDQRRGDTLDRFEDNREHLGQLTSLLQLKLTRQHKATFGVEQLFQRLDSERLSTLGARYRLAAFSQDAWRVYKHGDTRFDVVPGVRVDVDSQFGTEVSPKLALQLEPDERWILRASYGRGFRAPSFQELLLRFENPTVGYVVVGNPNLDAETSHGFDLAATWAAREWLDLGATFFRNDLSNMIAIVSGEMLEDGTRYTYENVATAWTMGVESFAGLRAGDELSFRVGYTWMATHDGENDRVLEGRPVHRITAFLHVAPAGWDADFNARFGLQLGRVFFRVDEMDVEQEQKADPLAQLDLRLSKHFTQHLELAVGVDNLLDAGDEYTVLRPRTFYGSIAGKY